MFMSFYDRHFLYHFCLLSSLNSSRASICSNYDNRNKFSALSTTCLAAGTESGGSFHNGGDGKYKCSLYEIVAARRDKLLSAIDVHSSLPQPAPKPASTAVIFKINRDLLALQFPFFYGFQADVAAVAAAAAANQPLAGIDIMRDKRQD